MTEPRAESTEMKRCEVCDWPLSERMEDGCIEGNCSYRPHEGTDEYYRIQKRRQDLKEKSAPIPEERAGREATPWFVGDGKEPDFTNPERFDTVGPLPGAVGAREYAALLVAYGWLEAQLAAQPSVQRDEDGIGWCSSCDKIHEVVRPKCPSCGDWLIFAADDKPEDSAKSFNDGVKAATDYLRKMHYMHTLADLADKTVLRITAERGSK